MNSRLQFIIFISIVITVYSLLNYYFIKKNRSILTARSLPVIFLRLIILTLILTPVATIFFSINEIPLMAAFTGFTGYSWIAFLFLFLMIHGLADILLFIAEKGGFKPSAKMGRKFTFLTSLVCISIVLYGYIEAKSIKTERVEIRSQKLNSLKKNIRIMQISDVHFSPVISVPKALKIKELVEKEKPDLLLSTGDLLDRAIRNSSEVSKILKSISAPLGKVAIMGNHEFIADIDYSTRFINECGFTLLRNRSMVIAGAVSIAGVDDISAPRFDVKIEKSEEEVLAEVDDRYYSILMKHQPRINKTTTCKFDLQLSGHTHAGQIFPFTLFVRLVFPYIAGMYQVDDNTKLYVSRGTGTWGPPVRFLASPEITIFDLKPELKPHSSL
jgi:predicted MPP superfamily phosphohydrolase